MGVVINNILAIYRKELRSYFLSPLAYVVAGVFWLLAGFFFVLILNAISQARFAQFDAPYEFVKLFLDVLGPLSLFLLPIFSMGLYAEERKRGTLELLATSPLTNWAVAVGKLLGVLTFFITLMVPLLVYQAIVYSASNPPIPPPVPLLANAALILLAASVLSLGMFMSSLTDSTLLAAVITFGLSLLLWVIEPVATMVGGSAGEVLGHLSLLKHYNNLVKGVVDTSSLILFASYIILGIFLTAQSIDALRFQRS
jgi:ABC-2 type transport system permease protein